MKYRIVRNYFAPMMKEWGEEDETPSHAILVYACNFDCVFCNRTFLDGNLYDNYSNDEFALAIMNLLPHGVRFKFSGGEPTLDSTLEEKMSLVRQCGGRIFLDSNGSFPGRVENLLRKGLVDVLGISLKGTSPERARLASGGQSLEFCWENPLKTIRLAERFPEVRFIATHVFYDGASLPTLLEFSELLPSVRNIRLKLNNLYYSEHRVGGLTPLPMDSFREMITTFLGNHSEWLSRTIVVENEKAIGNYGAIRFL